MRFSSAIGVLALAASACGKELAKDAARAAELYDSGLVHQKIFDAKLAFFEAEQAAGAYDTSIYPRLNYTKCVNGYAAAIPGDPLHTFKCKNMDLYDFINHAALGSPLFNTQYNQTGSSVWGWTDPESGREFIAAGLFQGTSMIEILPIGRMVYLGMLPSYSTLGNNALWREVRGYKHYVLIASELAGHGIQIFDMTKLLDIDHATAPVMFDNVVGSGIAGHFADVPLGRIHNVVINEELEYGVAVGAQPRTGPCKAGLIFFSLKDVSDPFTLGCDGQDGYVHDAQCLVYHGPDTKYEGRDICYGYNEDTLTIYDVTDKKASKVISRTSYEGASYTHQGWVLDTKWQEWLIMDDEFDEEEFAGPAADGYPVTYIWDIRSLEAPKQTGIYKAAVKGIDHNQYVIDGLSYQSNYGAGFRVYDVSSIPSDPTGNSVCEIAFMDIYPEDDAVEGGGIIDYFGTWGSYAYFKSGYIFVNTQERGGFLMKMTKKEACKPKSCNADNCLRAMRSTSVKGRLEESQAFCGEFTKTFVADVSVVKDYAKSACAGNLISRVSSACSCLPTASASP
ncbi:hypothetical protein DL98DRAFT_574162 [Cadophora sp. DSE1049]|nr:hypothetical protein DL98DRAFT_574162 [Cadophora sp. DSE1049]